MDEARFLSVDLWLTNISFGFASGVLIDPPFATQPDLSYAGLRERREEESLRKRGGLRVKDRKRAGSINRASQGS
jgi:hypothetical protein